VCTRRGEGKPLRLRDLVAAHVLSSSTLVRSPLRRKLGIYLATSSELLRMAIMAKELPYVGTRGNPGDPAVIIGEAPGADEERLGLPFVGASGKEQGRMLNDAGWEGRWQLVGGEKLFCPFGLWYTNVYKVRPPENKLFRLQEYGIPDELFRKAFIEELQTYKPSIIIATGNTSLGGLCPFTLGKDSKARIGTYRGSLLKSPFLDWEHYVIPMFHPAFILREWSERPVGVFCLERAWEEFAYLGKQGKLQPLPERNLKVQPPYEDLYHCLRSCLSPVKRRVSIDIELLGGARAYTVAIATSPTEAFAFSIGEFDYSPDQLYEIWMLLDEILRTCPQIGQNYIGFDCVWFEYLGLSPDLRIFESKVEDSMVLHHILWPELPHKLQFLTMQYTREPYYKDEGRKWKPKQGLGPLLRYNALDAAVTFEAMLEMEKELEERCGSW